MGKIALSTTGAIAESIAEVTKLVRLWIGSTDQRRMAKCIRNADKLVAEMREQGLDNKKLVKLMDKHDKYNN